MRPRSLLLALAGPVLLTACTGGQPADPPAPAPVVLDVGGGAGARLLAGPAAARVQPGQVVRLRSVHAGEQGSSVTHLLTSAPPGQGPTVFSRVRAGAQPNGAVWGGCLGGQALSTTVTCPVPPVEGPRTWDGEDYLSLGAVLAGETRELTLADRLPADAVLRLWCRLHPTLQVTLTTGADPAPAPAPVRPAAVQADVVVAPELPDAPGESLTFAPALLTVRAGATVTWRTTRPSPHSVELGVNPELGDTQPADSTPVVPPGGAAPGVPARSGFLSTDPGAPGGTTFRLRFPRPGRYDYACRFHPTMRGTVVVTA